jgi:hypothetical protein
MARIIDGVRLGKGPAPLAIVTATTDVSRAADCLASWREQAIDKGIPTLIVQNGGQTGEPYYGTVGAFRRGVDELLATTQAEVIACFHDDLEIREYGWDARVLRHFDRQPACGLAGFGGALGLGAANIYQVPYDPMQLARQYFRSNLIDAEHHGMRSLLSERVACLDGFSQIGRRGFWLGHEYISPIRELDVRERPWQKLERLGIVHHFYDGMLGCLAKRYGWEAWYLPVACIHYGGRTAVGDPGYQEWANDKTKTTEGDHEFWKAAHKVGYEEFRDVLPIRIPQ